MSNNDGGNVRLQDEKTKRYLPYSFHNVCASHSENSTHHVDYDGQIRANYSRQLWNFLKDKQRDGTFRLIGQFYYGDIPEVMDITHLVLAEIEIVKDFTSRKDFIKIVLKSTWDSKIMKTLNKHLTDIRISEPFVFR
jgi:hypothetical protein